MRCLCGTAHRLLSRMRVSGSVDYLKQEIVLLATLNQDVLIVEKHVGGSGCIGVGYLLLVDGDTTALYHLAHLALGGEYGGMVGEEVGELYALAR